MLCPNELRIKFTGFSLTGYLPFQKVILHGLVRDESGRKMSKSLGNVIDPMDVIDGITVQKMLKRLDKSTFSEVEKSRVFVVELKFYEFYCFNLDGHKSF